MLQCDSHNLVEKHILETPIESLLKMLFLVAYFSTGHVLSPGFPTAAG